MSSLDAPVPKNALNRNLSEQIAELIGTRILSATYLPGRTLPDEPLLGSEFGVSRTVICEAIRMLVSKGMLEVRPRIGTRVLEPGNWQLLDREVLHWQQSVKIDGQQLRELIELRQAVEPQAAKFAAERRTDGDLQAIGYALGKMELTVGINSEYAIADAQFHIAVLRAAKNRYFDALESAIFAGLLLSIRVTNPNELNRKSLPLHRNIADAIIARNPDAAQVAMQDHLANSASRLAKNVRALSSAK